MYTALLRHRVLGQNTEFTILEATCECTRSVEHSVSTEDYVGWLRGSLVQNAFPYMSAEYREWFFMSGTCPGCWDKVWFDFDYEE